MAAVAGNRPPLPRRGLGRGRSQGLGRWAPRAPGAGGRGGGPRPLAPLPDFLSVPPFNSVEFFVLFCFSANFCLPRFHHHPLSPSPTKAGARSQGNPF